MGNDKLVEGSQMKSKSRKKFIIGNWRSNNYEREKIIYFFLKMECDTILTKYYKKLP